jgi:hypothetical protein
MNTMKMPGFTAEASLSKTSERYNLTQFKTFLGSNPNLGDAQVILSQPSWGDPGSGLYQDWSCQNDCYQRATEIKCDVENLNPASRRNCYRDQAADCHRWCYGSGGPPVLGGGFFGPGGAGRGGGFYRPGSSFFGGGGSGHGSHRYQVFVDGFCVSGC